MQAQVLAHIFALSWLLQLLLLTHPGLLSQLASPFKQGFSRLAGASRRGHSRKGRGNADSDSTSVQLQPLDPAAATGEGGLAAVDSPGAGLSSIRVQRHATHTGQVVVIIKEQLHLPAPSSGTDAPKTARSAFSNPTSEDSCNEQAEMDAEKKAAKLSLPDPAPVGWRASDFLMVEKLVERLEWRELACTYKWVLPAPPGLKCRCVTSCLLHCTASQPVLV